MYTYIYVYMHITVDSLTMSPRVVYVTKRERGWGATGKSVCCIMFAERCSALQCAVVRRTVLQYVAVALQQGILAHEHTCRQADIIILQYGAVHCSALQYVATALQTEIMTPDDTCRQVGNSAQRQPNGNSSERQPDQGHYFLTDYRCQAVCCSALSCISRKIEFSQNSSARQNSPTAIVASDIPRRGVIFSRIHKISHKIVLQSFYLVHYRLVHF